MAWPTPIARQPMKTRGSPKGLRVSCDPSPKAIKMKLMRPEQANNTESPCLIVLVSRRMKRLNSPTAMTSRVAAHQMEILPPSALMASRQIKRVAYLMSQVTPKRKYRQGVSLPTILCFDAASFRKSDSSTRRCCTKARAR